MGNTKQAPLGISLFQPFQMKPAEAHVVFDATEDRFDLNFALNEEQFVFLRKQVDYGLFPIATRAEERYPDDRGFTMFLMFAVQGVVFNIDSQLVFVAAGVFLFATVASTGGIVPGQTVMLMIFFLGQNLRLAPGDGAQVCLHPFHMRDQTGCVTSSLM